MPVTTPKFNNEVRQLVLRLLAAWPVQGGPATGSFTGAHFVERNLFGPTVDTPALDGQDILAALRSISVVAGGRGVPPDVAVPRAGVGGDRRAGDSDTHVAASFAQVLVLLVMAAPLHGTSELSFQRRRTLALSLIHI